MKYYIVTTVKNEEAYISETIESVINQTCLPIEWIIIDDQSVDGTKDIIQKYSNKYDFIKYRFNNSINLQEKGARISSIINETIKGITDEYDLVSKLDADVKFDNLFYENIIKEFEIDKNLGIASGSLIYKGKKEKNLIDFFTRGATKVYRKACFIDIDGLYPITGWDTIDLINANFKGWVTRTLYPEFHHLKEEGRTQGYFRKYYDAGKYYGQIPYIWVYLILKLGYRIFSWPPFLSSFYMLMGYIKGRYLTKKRIFSAELARYFQQKQRSILKGFIT